jgi:hypothetical protein
MLMYLCDLPHKYAVIMMLSLFCNSYLRKLVYFFIFIDIIEDRYDDSWARRYRVMKQGTIRAPIDQSVLNAASILSIDG